MNIVFLSPHFPPAYYLFCVHLRRLGANVLGIADEHLPNLRRELRDALTEYYRVGNLEDYDQVLRAVGYFTHRYGRIDRVASHNEHWLPLEAYLRENFNIHGKKIDATAQVQRKSLMKKKFVEAGVEVAPGRLVPSLDDALAFAQETGYPVIAKPDRGVGAAGTFKLSSDDEVRHLFDITAPVDYFMETYVEGDVVTFDGLTDHEGRIVFQSSLEYSRSILDVVAHDDHLYAYTLRELPEDLVKAGTASVRAFELREQFFHIEFFRTPAGRLLGLEINARPPGWPTTDLFNYANDADCYREWANVVMRHPIEYAWTRKYHSIFIGRKNSIRYRHSHDEIVQRHGRFLIDTLQMPPAFAAAMGDYAYIARSVNLPDLEAMAAFVHERA